MDLRPSAYHRRTRFPFAYLLTCLHTHGTVLFFEIGESDPADITALKTRGGKTDISLYTKCSNLW